MSVWEWLTLVGVCLMGAVSPGPSLLVIVDQTVNGSRLNGLVAAVAHGLMVGGWALLTVLGISQLLLQMPQLQTLLTLFAVGYLLNLARNVWRSGRVQLVNAGVQQRHSLVAAARAGAAIGLYNPKLALFFIALFAPFVADHQTFAEKMLLVLTPLTTDTLWYLLVAVLLSGRTGLYWLQRHQRGINRLLAVLLTLLAAVMLAGLF